MIYWALFFQRFVLGNDLYSFYLKMRSEQIATEDKIISKRNEECGVRNEGMHRFAILFFKNKIL